MTQSRFALCSDAMIHQDEVGWYVIVVVVAAGLVQELYESAQEWALNIARCRSIGPNVLRLEDVVKVQFNQIGSVPVGESVVEIGTDNGQVAVVLIHGFIHIPVSMDKKTALEIANYLTVAAGAVQ